ncbi:MAG: tRNA pseudouridine(13) synthase TruD [Deferrisomatales bacterium]|nr:tRNA pseudouridine(13) synthase TruD [Deferrisomatales bacterium]
MPHPNAPRTDLHAAPFRDFSYPLLLRGLCPPLAVGGTWQATPETFRVEEIPAYQWCGEGEHAALTVEKAGLTTRDLATAVARTLGVSPSAVGYAGMKDKNATTVQGFTVTGVDTERTAAAFTEAGCRVLQADRHRNKLRLGHLAGNRFRTWLSGADPEHCRVALEQLVRHGVPNYYGPQRFGMKGDNAAAGLRVLRGEKRVKRWQHDLLTSALQSFVFNEVLARRLEAGELDTALSGDVLRKEDSGGLFLCVDPTQDGERLRAFEVSPTGPMPGRKMVDAEAETARREASVLADLGLEESLFHSLRGTRRALRSRVDGVTVEPADAGVWLTFALPAGAFATALLRELTG